MPTLKAVVLEYRGGMQFDSSPSSGHPYKFDDRESNQGGSPVETILASLGSCSAMDVVSIAGKQRQKIDSYRIDVRGTQRDEYPQVYTEITVTHEIIGRDLSEIGIQRCIELSAVKYCPVNAMISAGATVVHHRYHIVSSGEQPYESEAEVVTTGPYARPDILADQT